MRSAFNRAAVKQRLYGYLETMADNAKRAIQRPLTEKEIGSFLDAALDVGGSQTFKRRLIAQFGVRPPATRKKSKA